ncbi:unnamed protein product [Danaus chrysippus]|uniref:(African queen) hypothetical protein n=1 Tax=Danaus chrysippus TaxID=151541 RepID=A0A8J2QPY3_9NEOP|nr:unnamed protein product [Danaus chrysippus]
MSSVPVVEHIAQGGRAGCAGAGAAAAPRLHWPSPRSADWARRTCSAELSSTAAPPGPGARGALIRPRTSLTAPLPLWTSTSERARRSHPEHTATRYDRTPLPTYDTYSDTWTDRL